MWKENLQHTVSVEKERMDIFHFNMALIELLSMIFLQEKKAKAWLLPFCMFFAQQSRKAKANARLLSYESWQVAPRRSKWTEMGSSLRRYFAGYSTVWLSHDTYHGRPSIRSKLKIEWIDGWMDLLVGTGVNTALENGFTVYNKIQSSLSPVEKSQTTLPGLINEWKISLDKVCLGNLPLIISYCLIWSSSMVQLVPKRRLPLCY